MPYRITKSFSFDAAHRLPNVPTGHKCGRIHGHSYQIILGLEGQLDEKLGWVQDYGEIKQIYEPLRQRLDHQYLNDVLDIVPTAEALAGWMFRTLVDAGLPVVRLRLWETPTSYAEVTP